VVLEIDWSNVYDVSRSCQRGVLESTYKNVHQLVTFIWLHISSITLEIFELLTGKLFLYSFSATIARATRRISEIRDDTIARTIARE